MPYRDSQRDKDNDATKEALHRYSGRDNASDSPDGDSRDSSPEEPSSVARAKRSIFGRLFKKKSVLGSVSASNSAGSDATASGVEEAVGGAAKKLAPRVIALIVCGGGIGAFSTFGLFTSYKNDALIRNDPPLQCEQGVVDLPKYGSYKAPDADKVAQETANTIVEVLSAQGYSKEAITAIVACMLVECDGDPTKLESDHLGSLKGAKETFMAKVGPGTGASSQATLDAWLEYGAAFESAGEADKYRSSYYLTTSSGRRGVGIGFLQNTGERGEGLILGLDKVRGSMPNVSVTDVTYQLAYMLYEVTTGKGLGPGNGDMRWTNCKPGSTFSTMTDLNGAVTEFYRWMVGGGSTNDEQVQKRKDRLHTGPKGIGAVELVAAAEAQSKYTGDVQRMVEALGGGSFVSAVRRAQEAVNCQNKTFINNADIAMAAVSISWLQRGDYEDEAGAYGEYRRDARSPLLINDWNYIEGGPVSGKTSSNKYKQGKYKDRDSSLSGTPKGELDYYTNNEPNGHLDLIACTEYYYYAHLIALPAEDGVNNPGWFSSCDRGAATAIRIAGADDFFVPGNPWSQLGWALGAKKSGANHNEDERGPNGDAKGYLWKFAGFMRGVDLYPATGSSSIAPGTVMISWSDDAANGYLTVSGGAGATGTSVGSDDDKPMVDVTPPTYDPKPSEDPNNYKKKPEDAAEAAAVGDKKSMKEANLRFPESVSNVQRHIMIFAGEDAVSSFWGPGWLYQQFSMFSDAESLVRGDMNQNVPTVMVEGMRYKGNYARKGADQHVTFYQTQAQALTKISGDDDAKKAKAFDDSLSKGFEALGSRKIEFNAKTGLPEFKSWEQIMVRLLHDADDDVAARKNTTENNLYIRYPTSKDNYLDGADDKIEQYQGEDTVADMYFFEDWNSIGSGKPGDDVSKYYNTDLEKDTTKREGLLYYDDGQDAWSIMRKPMPSASPSASPSAGASPSPSPSASPGASPSASPSASPAASNRPYWRYELIADIEYRLNQLYRFALAAGMCSLPSEEDADIVQTGTDMDNNGGHILGNVYRRYSRIPDYVDASGRFYYYNTVVSNDMLQDLVQLYTNERNGDNTGDNYKKRNFGPMNLLGLTEDKGGFGYDPEMWAGSGWFDRRYGLSAIDVALLKEKDSVNKTDMGKDGAAMEALKKGTATAMHKIDAVTLALYDRTKTANTAVDGAHEGEHKFAAKASELYEGEVYGLNPFLMLESAANLNYAQDLSPGKDDWTDGSTKGVRNSIFGIGGSSDLSLGKSGVDDRNSKLDDRLAWIDRHYYQAGKDTVGTFGYAVIGLNQSTGTQVNGGEAGYNNALKSVKTLPASPKNPSAADTDAVANKDNMYGSKDAIRYTDYIYSEGKDEKGVLNNNHMAKRLLFNDNRYGEGAEPKPSASAAPSGSPAPTPSPSASPSSGEAPNETKYVGDRDDYNRREWIVIPYRHTHSQQCVHDPALKNYLNGNYKLDCDWYGNDAAATKYDTFKVDTQMYLNYEGMSSNNDYGDTMSYSLAPPASSSPASSASPEPSSSASPSPSPSASVAPANVIDNRGKYVIGDYMNNYGVKYYADLAAEDVPQGGSIGWQEITIDMKPPMHVKCYGVDCPGVPPCATPKDDGTPCGNCKAKCPVPDCDHEHTCLGPPCDGHNHTCNDLLTNHSWWDHNHKECDSGNSLICAYGSSHPPYWHDTGKTAGRDGVEDICHTHYGCNMLEYLYHTGKPVYMALPVVETPIESMTLTKFLDEYVRGEEKMTQSVSGSPFVGDVDGLGAGFDPGYGNLSGGSGGTADNIRGFDNLSGIAGKGNFVGNRKITMYCRGCDNGLSAFWSDQPVTMGMVACSNIAMGSIITIDAYPGEFIVADLCGNDDPDTIDIFLPIGSKGNCVCTKYNKISSSGVYLKTGFTYYPPYRTNEQIKKGAVGRKSGVSIKGPKPPYPGGAAGALDPLNILYGGGGAITGGVVYVDRGNILQQITYKSGGGIHYSWQELINGDKGSLVSPDKVTSYHDKDKTIFYINGYYGTQKTYNGKILTEYGPGWSCDSGVSVGAKNGTTGLIGYFTIEGNIIRSDDKVETDGDSETLKLDDNKYNSTKDDLIAFEPTKYKVGYGKSLDQTVWQAGGALVKQSVSQGTYDTKSGLKSVGYYDRSTKDANVPDDAPYNGYGEAYVTGAQHFSNPTDQGGKYANTSSGSGPDGANGNAKAPFKSSVMRDLLGDEHVMHITMAAVDKAGLEQDVAEENGRGFFTKYTYKKDGASTESEAFVDTDDDIRYLDPKLLEATTSKYFCNVGEHVTDKSTCNEHGNAACVENKKVSDGDNAYWITHASRGKRGMKTQYMNFKGFFKDVHESGITSVENHKDQAYMLFTNVKRTRKDGSSDEDFFFDAGAGVPQGGVESPGSLKYVWGTGVDFITDNSGNVVGVKPKKYSDTYGQGANSHWKNMIDLYNDAMSETRQQ